MIWSVYVFHRFYRDPRRYDPLLDSSNMSQGDWLAIARDIEENYLAYDGFVILHGTGV